MKKYLEAQQVWASKNIKNEPENVKKSIYHLGKVKTAEEDGILKVLYQIRRPLGLVFVILFLVAGRIVAALYLAEL